MIQLYYKARGTSRSCQIKNTREREIKHIATGTYPQPRGWTTPSSSWRPPGWLRWPPVMVSPSGRVPKRGPDWFFVAREACGGGAPDLGYVLEVWVYIRGVGVGNKSGGSQGGNEVGGAQGVGRTPHPRGGLGTLLAQLFYSRGFFWSIKNHRKFSSRLDSVWYSFFAKLKNKEKTETGTGL